MAITVKTWTGAESERFTHADMNRICSNANTLASALALETIPFPTATRSSQFDIDTATKLENMIATMAANVEVDVETTFWTVGRTISYVDLNRWEQSLKAIETASATIWGYNLRFSSPGEMDDIFWALSTDAENVATGTHWGRSMVFRVNPGTYRLLFSAYGRIETMTVTVTGNTAREVTILGTVTIKATPAISRMTLDDYDVSPPSPVTQWQICAIRAGNSYQLYIEGVNDAPIIESAGGGPYWTREYSKRIEMNSQTLTVDIPRVGREMTFSETGMLTLPKSAKFEIFAIGGGECGERFTTYGLYGFRGGKGGRGGGIFHGNAILSDTLDMTMGAGGYWDFNTIVAPTDTIIRLSSGAIYTAEGGRGAGGGGANVHLNEASGYGSNEGGDGNIFVGGGGGGSRNGTGGKASTNSGRGGSSGNAGANGTIIDGLGRGGAGGTGGASGPGGGGGGGGYGADGGAGGYDGGGGGGGIYGGTGGTGGRYDNSPSRRIHASGGLGYGAGGGGGTSQDNVNGDYRAGGGGGGGGMGTEAIAGAATGFRGGNGAPGAVRIKWVSDE